MNNWQAKKLGEVLSLEYGKGLTESVRVNGNISVYGSNGIVGIHNTKLVNGPGIIIGRKGSIGEVVWCDSDFWPIDTTYYIKLLQSDNLRFIYYVLQTLNLKSLNKASGVPGLNRSDVYKITIGLPSLTVQQQIVERLDAIKKMQNLNQKEIEKAEELFDSFFNSIFSLTNDWTIKKISDVTVINPPKPKFHEWDLEKEVDFLPMSALATDAQNPFTAEKRKLKQVIKGYTCFQSDDILLAKITPCFENGKTGIFRKNPKSVGFGSTEFIVLRADEKKVIPLWVWLFIFSKRFRQEGKLHMTGTAGQKRLPVSFVENYQIPVPSLNIQQQIIEKFQNIASLFELKKKEKEKLTELFESTLNKFVNNKQYEQ